MVVVQCCVHPRVETVGLRFKTKQNLLTSAKQSATQLLTAQSQPSQHDHTCLTPLHRLAHPSVTGLVMSTTVTESAADDGDLQADGGTREIRESSKQRKKERKKATRQLVNADYSPPTTSTPFNSPHFHPDLYPSAAAVPSVPSIPLTQTPLNLSLISRQEGVNRNGGGVFMQTPFHSSYYPMQTPLTQSRTAPMMTPIDSNHSLHQQQLQAIQLQQQLLQAQMSQQQQSMQAVYATPAAWRKQKEYLINQPTPKVIESLAIPSTLGRRPHLAIEGKMISPPVNIGRSTSTPSSEHTFATSGSTRRHARSASTMPSPTHPDIPPHNRSSSMFGSASKFGNYLSKLDKLEQAKASLKHLKQQHLAYQEERATVMQKSRIQQTFLSLSSFLIVLFVAALCYYDYLILSPHIHSLIWAFLFWILLDTPQKWLLRLFEEIDSRFLTRTWSMRLEIGSIILTIVIGFYLRNNLGSLIILAILFVIFTFFLFGDRHTVTAILLLFFILLLIAFPLFLFIKTCVLESQEIAHRLRSFIDTNPEFQHILEDFSSSSTFLAIQNYIRGWGYEIPKTDVAKLREMILKSIVQFADQITTILTSVYGLISNVGNLMMSLITFASMLYFLLVSNKDLQLDGTLSWLSPFSAEDNARLVSALKDSIMRIFVCSLCVGVLHVCVTYVSFSLCGIDLCLILSFVSGFTSMLPIFSSWIVWLPACGGLLLAGRHMAAAVLCGIQMTLLFYVDPLIYSNIPGNSYVIGLSIVFAAYTFGASGVLLGPLLAGITFTFLSIYRDYISLPILTPSIPNPADFNRNNTGASGVNLDPGLAMGYGGMFGAHQSGRSVAGSGSMMVPDSLSTVHSSNTLNKLAEGLQAVADAQAATPASTSSPSNNIHHHPSPTSSTPASTSRTLKFATPLYHNNTRSPQSASSLYSSTHASINDSNRSIESLSPTLSVQLDEDADEEAVHPLDESTLQPPSPPLLSPSLSDSTSPPVTVFSPPSALSDDPSTDDAIRLQQSQLESTHQRVIKQYELELMEEQQRISSADGQSAEGHDGSKISPPSVDSSSVSTPSDSPADSGSSASPPTSLCQRATKQKKTRK